MKERFLCYDAAEAVFDRLKTVYQVKTAKQLTGKINISESGISAAIKRDTVPYTICADTSKAFGVPMDWLLFGDVDGHQCQRSYDPQYFRRAYFEAVFEPMPDSPLLRYDGGLDGEIGTAANTELQMLITGWQGLNRAQQDTVFDLIRGMVRSNDGLPDD